MHLLENSRIAEAYAMICEDAEGKNINRAEKYIKNSHPEVIGRTLDNGVSVTPRVMTQEIRNLMPNTRLADCKFLLGATRMYFDSISKNPDEMQRNASNLNKILKIVASDAHVSEYDSDLNGISYNELDKRFSKSVQNDLNRDKDDVGGEKYEKNDAYDIVKIPDFKTASKYGRYVSWCVTHDENMYDNYTQGGAGVFYFILKKGFENVEAVVGKDAPNDEYGLSMVAVSVNDDGSLNTCTTRWNHDNGGNDSVMTTSEISRLVGQNFYETFKPRSSEEVWHSYEENGWHSDISDIMGGLEISVDEGDRRTFVKKDAKSGRILKFFLIGVYGNKICLATDHFVWFDKAEKRECEPPAECNGDIVCAFCNSLKSLRGSPRRVRGMFNVSFCNSLASLEGSPYYVGGTFYCSGCRLLTSLDGGPSKVGATFTCERCQSLKTLRGAPKSVGKAFNCEGCSSLDSLYGMPKHVGSDVYCENCSSLKSLVGSPETVMLDFSCSNCESLSTLEGGPKHVNGSFRCDRCRRLTSLVGAPETVGYSFYCGGCNSIATLYGAPKHVGRTFDCHQCSSLKNLVGSPEVVGGDFDCEECKSLTSLKGAPKHVGGRLTTKGSPIQLGV